MWRQAKALIAAYYRSKRNRWTSEKTFSTVMMALGAFFMVAVSIGAAVGLFFLGLMFEDFSETRRLAALDAITLGYLFFWLAFFMMDVQQTDVFDLRKLLYLPVSVRTIVGLNYAASLVSILAIPFFLPMAGLTAGLLVSRGLVAALIVPLCVAFYLALSAFAYLVRGAISAMMQNKRQRQFIMTVLPLMGMLIGLGPSLLSQAARAGLFKGIVDTDAKLADGTVEYLIAAANALVPPLWLPYGIHSLLAGDWSVWMATLAGLLILTAGLLYLSYRSAVHFHMGVSKKFSPKAKGTASERDALPPLPRNVPWLAPDTAAMVHASFQTYKRHPQIRVAMLSALLTPMFIMLPLMSINDGKSAAFSSHGMFVIFVIAPLFGMMAFLCNLFGADRAGFQALILLPTPRYKYIVAKNVAIFPFTGGMALLMTFIAGLVLRSGVSATFTALVLALQAWIFIITLGNFLSIKFPFDIPDSAMMRKSNSRFTLPQFLANIFLFTVTGGVVFACLSIDGLAQSWLNYTGPSIGFIVALVLLAATAMGYGATIPAAGRALYAEEQTMLTKLRRDKE